jgi:hypothetical protein
MISLLTFVAGLYMGVGAMIGLLNGSTWQGMLISAVIWPYIFFAD